MRLQTPLPATVSGSADVNSKEKDVTTPELATRPKAVSAGPESWHEIIQTEGHCADLAGFGLECLIDLQRNHRIVSGEGR